MTYNNNRILDFKLLAFLLVTFYKLGYSQVEVTTGFNEIAHEENISSIEEHRIYFVDQQVSEKIISPIFYFDENGFLIKKKIISNQNQSAEIIFSYNERGEILRIDSLGLFANGSTASAFDTIRVEICTELSVVGSDEFVTKKTKIYLDLDIVVVETFKYDSLGLLKTQKIEQTNAGKKLVPQISHYTYNDKNLVTEISFYEDTLLVQKVEYVYKYF